MLSQRQLYFLTFTIACITLAAYFTNLYYGTPLSQGIQATFGSIFILFLPGYYITGSFFSGDEIDTLECFALSFALSISVVPLTSFCLNLVGLPINFISIFILVLVIICFNIGYQLTRKNHVITK